MRRLLFIALALLTTACGSSAPLTPLASGPWKTADLSTIQAASVTNGPWTLAQGPATLAKPLAGYCAGGVLQTNTSTRLMQPYYFPFITGSGQNLEGYFDYRVKDQDEALVHAKSSDGGLTWTTDATKLRLNATTCPKDEATAIGNDNGQGHGVVLTVGGKTLLYTLDRVASVVDSGGLLVHDLTGGASVLPDNEPVSDAKPVPAGVQQTVGLQNPDGILGVVPGATPLTVLYLKKLKGSKTAPAAGLDAAKLCQDSQSQPLTSKKANYDLTELRLATTSDGITFTDKGAVAGLNNPNDNSPNGFRYIGPRGTLLQYSDKTYGLFFSGGNCSDGDSDAYHFIGYAHSSDAQNWTVDSGPANPLVQVDYSYPSALPAAYYSGRVYDPNVIVNPDGTATLFFSGYRTGKPLPDQNVATGSPAVTFTATDAANYRSILMVKLKR